MGLNKPPDLEEEKFIYEHILKGCTNAEILRILERKFQKRDERTIRKIRKKYAVAEEVLRQLGRIRGVQGGSAKKDVETIIEIQKNLQKGLHAVVNEETGEITYKSVLEI